MCPLECHKSSLDMTIASLAYPTSSLYVDKILKQKPSLLAKYANDSDFSQNLANNVVQFNIFYDTLGYTLVEEEAKISYEDLIGSIGGHLHIFLGMSSMSFIELFLLGFELLFVYVKAKRDEDLSSA